MLALIITIIVIIKSNVNTKNTIANCNVQIFKYEFHLDYKDGLDYLLFYVTRVSHYAIAAPTVRISAMFIYINRYGDKNMF